ncbi:MAG: SRPBCC family protein [Bacteroidia bacterium]
METFLFIIGALASFIALLLIAALFVKKDYHIQCESFIQLNKEEVFNFLIQLKNQDHFNKWVMAEPDMKKEFRGTDGEPGFVYYWSGKKAGEGELELSQFEYGKSIKTEIRFIRPFVSKAYSNYYLEALSEKETKVIWTNESEMKYPLNLLLPLVKNMLVKDMESSLQTLNQVIIKQNN